MQDEDSEELKESSFRSSSLLVTMLKRSWYRSEMNFSMVSMWFFLRFFLGSGDSEVSFGSRVNCCEGGDGFGAV